MAPSPEQLKIMKLEQELLKSLFYDDISLEEKIKKHAEFRIKYRPQWPYSTEGTLMCKWEKIGLIPDGTWLTECQRRNRVKRKGFDTSRKVLRKSVPTCQRCGSKSDLEVHHIISIYHGGSNEEKNLMVLCKLCHHQYHSPNCECDLSTFLKCRKKECENPFRRIQYNMDFEKNTSPMD